MIDKQKIVQEVRKMKCKKHNEHPEIKIVNKGYEVSACCDDFKNKVIQRIADENANQIGDIITGSIT